MKPLLFASVALAVSLCTLTGPAAFASEASDAAIRAQATAFEKAVAAKDATAIGALWTPNGVYIHPNGTVYVGREEIAKLFTEFFQLGNQSVKVEIGSLRDVGTDTVIEKGTTYLNTPEGRTVSKAKYIAVHRLVNGAWQIGELTEYPAEPTRQSLADLDWIVGSWQTKGSTDEMKVHNLPSANGKFLISEFGSVKRDRNGGDLMVTAVNPMSGRLASWFFDANGGVGTGYWDYSNGKWYITSNRVSPTGQRVSLTHVLHPEGKTGFTWQTIDRTVDGVNLPDTGTVEVVRVAEGNP
jgi:uncharacterized protein (TIGR02246 family)